MERGRVWSGTWCLSACASVSAEKSYKYIPLKVLCATSGGEDCKAVIGLVGKIPKHI